MLNQKEILSTIEMIDQQHLDIRTITMGISLLSCCDPDPKKACDKIYDKITRYAENLVKTGEDIESELGIPIVHKRISVTPMALVAGASDTEDYVPFALTLERAAKTCGVNFIGGYSALVLPPPRYCQPPKRSRPRAQCPIFWLPSSLWRLEEKRSGNSGKRRLRLC
jgi:uncharacterized protein (UPF0210 family)